MGVDAFEDVLDRVRDDKLKTLLADAKTDHEMLGIEMPELPGEFGAEVGYYSIIAEIVAETEYVFPDGAMLVFRLCPEADLDISGVYGAEFYEDWDIFGTEAEIDTYEDMFVAIGNVSTMDETVYSFAVDAEGLDEESFYKVVSFFIESCMNQRIAE